MMVPAKLGQSRCDLLLRPGSQMIAQCLPPQSRQFYIRLKAQKQEEASSRYRERLTGLRSEHAARGSPLSGQQLLAEWQLSETFIGAMASGLLDAALKTCELYQIPLDQDLSSCIENEIKAFIDAQFGHALRNHSSPNRAPLLPTNIRRVFEGRIHAAKFSILNPIQIRLETARVTGTHPRAQRQDESKGGGWEYAARSEFSGASRTTIIHLTKVTNSSIVLLCLR